MLSLVAMLLQVLACSNAEFSGQGGVRSGEKEKKEETKITTDGGAPTGGETTITEPSDVAGGFGLTCVPSDNATDPNKTDFACTVVQADGKKFEETATKKLAIEVSRNLNVIPHTMEPPSSKFSFKFTALTLDGDKIVVNVKIINPLNNNAISFTQNWNLTEVITKPLNLFISVWDIGTVPSPNLSYRTITIPTERGGDYAFMIDRGDSSTQSGWQRVTPQSINGPFSLQYSDPTTPQIITIRISGIIKGFRFTSAVTTEPAKLVEIKQFGPLQLGNNGGYFKGATNLKITATDAPDLTGTTNLSEAFFGCSNLDSIPGIESWKVGGVTDMSQMFAYATKFNQSMGAWKLNSYVNLTGMLDQSGIQAEVYGKILADWNVNPETPAGRSLGAKGITCNQQARQERSILISAKGWTIADGCGP